MHSGRKHLVLIDDAEDNLEVFRIILEEDYTVTACRCCTEALAALEKQPADLLLMDIAMSEIDGITCLEKIRALRQHKNTPAIAVTAYAYERDKQKILAAGFAAFIAKPVLDHDLLRRIINDVIAGVSGQSA
jgi:CheY-like chemotaxis protein